MIDAYTAHRHVRAVAGTGVLTGVFLLNEYVLRKGLGGSRWHILALLLVPALAQFLAVIWNPLGPSGPLGRRPFRVVAMPLHLLLLLPLLLGGALAPALLVGILALCGATQMLLVPVQNRTLAANYGVTTRGRRFGVANAVQALAIVLVCVPAGALLDLAPGAWPWLYALAGGAALYAYAQWSRLRRRRPPARPDGVRDARSPWEALRHDRSFLLFEAGFMLYGLGFLMLQPVLPLYLVDELGVSYGQVGIARGAVFWSANVLAAPLMGRLCDRIGVLRLTALAFFALACFPLILLAGRSTLCLYAAFAVFGAAMSGVFLAWTLGPMLFAGNREPYPYLSAHLGLVGIRALLGMVGATLLHEVAGSGAVFATVTALEVAAASWMLALSRLDLRRRRMADVTKAPSGTTAPPI